MTFLPALGGLAVAMSVVLVSGPACAEDDAGCTHVTRANVARCAVKVSAAVRSDEQATAAATGRRAAATPWFPANPLLTLSAARRGATPGNSPVLDLYGTLSQEIEIAGQRGARLRAADADTSARRDDMVATRRRVAAAALTAYFDALAARDALLVARRLEATGAQIAKVTRSRADAGVTSSLDAEVMEATSLRLAQSRVSAEREQRRATATLTTLLGQDPLRSSITIDGALEPLPGSDALLASTASRVLDRPEVRSLVHEQQSFAATADVYRRGRYPNVTLQVYAQNDGYNEKVFGGGFSAPIPLPEPVGRRNEGQIAENEALARRSSERADAVTRELTTDLAIAIAEYETRRTEADLYTADRVTRTGTILAELGKEIEAGRLPVRDAIVAQQQLIDVLRGYVDTRRALCVSSVKLALAANAPIDGGSP